MSTIKDVARVSGYSISTVSYALKGNEKIPLETQNKIKKVASELSYVPNASARALKTRKNYSIGVFVPGFKGHVHPTILSGIAAVIKEVRNKYKLIITLADQEFLLVYEKQIDVAIIIGSHVSEERVIDISKHIPVILVDNNAESDNIINTNIDNFGGMFNRVLDFYQKGVNRFIYMSGTHLSAHNTERLRGFRTGIETCDLKIDEQVILDVNAFDEERGYKTMKSYLLNHKLSANGLICANDELAIGAIKALKEEGIHIPNDIKVSGFDNIAKCVYLLPSLSTISVDWFAYGQRLGELALAILDGKEYDKKILIESTLINRCSE